MAWSSYAHLPNSEDEYWKILSGLRDEMSVAEADKVIANVKEKKKVTHHYRSNLAKIGLYDVKDGKIFLNYDVIELIKRKQYLKEILMQCIMNTENTEIQFVKSIVLQEKSYDMKKIVNCIQDKYPELERSNLIRWLRPVVNLLKITEILESDYNSLKCRCERYLQEAYLGISETFGNVISLEDLDKQLKKIDASYHIENCLDVLLEDGNVKFKIELLMMPAWAAKKKVYKIDGDYYTHLRIKSSFV